ncbi:hypothetical protein KC354_g143 [Hortaea werneckii]|nr:hypothetical protein KC354_g143 [Hortaea werneckii]
MKEYSPDPLQTSNIFCPLSLFSRASRQFFTLQHSCFQSAESAVFSLADYERARKTSEEAELRKEAMTPVDAYFRARSADKHRHSVLPYPFAIISTCAWKEIGDANSSSLIPQVARKIRSTYSYMREAKGKRVEPRRRRTLVSSPTTTSSALIPSTPSSSAVASTIPSSVSSAIPASIPTTATRSVRILTTSTTVPTSRRPAWRRTVPGRKTLRRHRRREAMRSGLLSELRRQRAENLLGSLSVPVPAISAVPVSGTTTSIPVPRRGTIVPRREIHTAAITPIPVLAQLNTAMCTARLPRHLPRSLDIAIVEDRLGELDAGEKHGFVDAGDSRHMVAYRGAFVLIEARILVLAATFEGEGEFGVREELLFLFGFAGETFEVCGDFVVERVFGAEDQGVGAETVAAAFVLGQHRVFGKSATPCHANFFPLRSTSKVENSREGMITSRRHDTHQLLVWPERLTLLKANNLLVHIDKVACEGCVVTLNIAAGNLMAELDIVGVDMEFLLVVAALVAFLPQPDGVFRHGHRLRFTGVRSISSAGEERIQLSLLVISRLATAHQLLLQRRCGRLVCLVGVSDYISVREASAETWIASSLGLAGRKSCRRTVITRTLQNDLRTCKIYMAVFGHVASHKRDVISPDRN